MTYVVDEIQNFLILRKPRSGCLEGPAAPIQPVFIFSHVRSRGMHRAAAALLAFFITGSIAGVR
jgi:hypothetical protein